MRVNSEQASVKEKDLKMGLSSNQARFLSLTSRQVDLEHRIQQICQRRLRLSSELEKVATQYNNSISNRKMFTPSTAGLNKLDLNTLKSLGYKVIDAVTKTAANSPIKAITQLSETAALSGGYDADHIIHNASEFVSKITSDLGGNFILTSDIDMSELGTLSNSAINGVFTGNFDGNGYTFSNLSINTSTTTSVGLFSSNTGIIKNVAIENAKISAANSNGVAALAGTNSGTVTNSYSSGNISGYQRTGGLVGINSGATAVISDSYSTADVSSIDVGAGGLSGVNWAGAVIERCYATGDVIGGSSGVGGLVGGNRATLNNSYSTGSVTGVDQVGGLVGLATDAAITNSYTTSSVYSSGASVGGITGTVGSGGSVDNTNFYKNNLSSPGSGSTAVNGNTNPLPTGTWNTSVWDLTTNLPSLISTGGINSERLEAGLRSGKYSLAREADEFTQESLTINGDEYEEIDWRSTPGIFDELYKGDDVEAENKYDKTVEEINAQDKKLQLEQTSIEVEYKAISSERESVKKILDQNAQSSFKYFS